MNTVTTATVNNASAYLAAATNKKCQSKKNTGAGGCGDPRCPQGMAINTALNYATETSNYELYEAVQKIQAQHDRRTAVDEMLKNQPTERQTFQNWIVAPAGKSGWYCKKCEYNLSHSEAGQVERTIKTCPNCNTKVTAESLGRYLLSETTTLFNPDEVRKISWFHATTREDWMDSLLSMNDAPLVHLGTQVSSVMRARDLRDDPHRPRGERWIIYETRIKSDARISSKVSPDDDQDFPYYVSETDNPRSKYGQGIIRYINGFEHPGSMSLLARPEDVEVVNVIEMNASEMDSWYENWIKSQ